MSVYASERRSPRGKLDDSLCLFKECDRLVADQTGRSAVRKE